MTQREILFLLQELLRDASIAQNDPDDHSGCNTRYYVDQDQLLKNIETKLKALEPKSMSPEYDPKEYE